MSKICSTCKKEKPLELTYFGKHNATKDGYRNECKECRNQKLAHHWNEDRSKLRCISCNEFKNPSMFDTNKNASHRDYKDRRCKCCKAIARQNRRTSRTRADQLHRLFVERYQGMRDRAKQRKLPMTLTVEDLKNLYIKQERKCAISGIEMTTLLGQGRVPTNASVDQIDPKQGYTKDNVQLVCMAVNQMKSDLPMDTLIRFCMAITKNAKSWGK